MIRTSMLGTETDASVAMAPAASAIVTVVATTDTVDQVNTNSAEVGVTVSSERLVSLPVITRNVVSAAILAPGVQLIQGSNVDPTKKSSTYMSTGEGQGRGTNFNIDGGDNNSTDVGGYVSPIPLDAIGEFQVVTNQYKAEFGRSNAGFLNVVSKSGSNNFMGIVSGQYTNQGLRARVTDEGIKKDNFSRTVAALASGPIIKDKLFFMASVERKDEEGAAFTFTPQAVAAFPALGGIKTQLKEDIAYLRFDWNVTQAVNATATYSYDKNETPFQAFPHTGAANGNVDPAMLGNGLNKTNRYGLKVTTMFTPNLIWESNLVYFDYNNGIAPNGDGPGGGTPLQVRTRNSSLLAISSSKLGRMGHDPNAYQNTGIKRLQWRNDFTYSLGDHTFKGGLDYQKSTYADQNLFWPETGIYAMRVAGIPFGPGAFANTVQADTNVTGVLLVPNGFQQGQTYKQFGFYAQDDWTISPKFAVYLGLRLDKDDLFDFMKPYQGLYTQIATANPELLHGSSVPTNKTYISPRVQAIYKPKGDDSITYKLGYGRFIAGMIDNVTGFSRALGNKANGISGTTIDNEAALAASGAASWGGNSVASFAQGTTLTVVNGHNVVLPANLTPYNYANNVNGLRDYFKNTVNGWLTTASVNTAGKALMASDFEYPTTDTFNVGATFKIGDHQSLDLQYIWSRTQHCTVQMATDGSDSRAWSPAFSNGAATLAKWNAEDGPANDSGDTVFLSNQTASSHQLQVKYTYTEAKWSAMANLVIKEFKSSFGGSAGSYDGHASADFYGGGANYAFLTNPERRSAGTESFSGSFAFTYNFDIGTKLGILGTWHSGKIYDIYSGYNSDLGAGNGTDAAHPNDYLGQGNGDWAMDLGIRISHSFKFGKGINLEPFIQISNVLNNYDYGSNYNNTYYDVADTAVKSADFGKRSPSYQNNAPRTAAFGFRLVF